MATRLTFYEALHNDPYLEDIEEWPNNHVRWLVEAFWMVSSKRIFITKRIQRFFSKSKNVFLKIAALRQYNKARRVLKQYAQPFLPMLLPRVIIYIRAKKCKTTREYNDLLDEYDQSDTQSNDEEGEEDEEDEEDDEEAEEGEEDEEAEEEESD